MLLEISVKYKTITIQDGSNIKGIEVKGRTYKITHSNL